jgi:hypothetical protein
VNALAESMPPALREAMDNPIELLAALGEMVSGAFADEPPETEAPTPSPRKPPKRR